MEKTATPESWRALWRMNQVASAGLCEGEGSRGGDGKIHRCLAEIIPRGRSKVQARIIKTPWITTARFEELWVGWSSPPGTATASSETEAEQRCPGSISCR